MQKVDILFVGERIVNSNYFFIIIYTFVEQMCSVSIFFIIIYNYFIFSPIVKWLIL